MHGDVMTMLHTWAPFAVMQLWFMMPNGIAVLALTLSSVLEDPVAESSCNTVCEVMLYDREYA